MSFARRGALTEIARFEQQGSLRARLPRPERGALAGAVVLNTAGGIASGDRFSTSVTWREGAEATVSAAAAERVYRARDDDRPARVDATLEIGPDALAEWLPQETILFDGARLDRSLSVSLGRGASMLLVEAVVFGRTARGERMLHGQFRDRIDIHREGTLVHADRIRLEGSVAAILDRAAVARGGAAIASIIWAGEGGEIVRDRLREAFAREAREGVEAGASLRDGLLLSRIVAADGAALRRMVVAGLGALRQNRPLPRVWQC
ncbi:urease accessory protein UreD [Elioraea rosea]|uniref:urease accessory protein UreD n=1 Tax=Elioraea rosea TaxID=2492390 RepID=UPI00131557EA|nr:urease accessory protein UreD [Elioraea rosea]